MEECDHHNGKKTKNKTPHLPFDLISEEILMRLPIKSLLRFRCVCKDWSSLIRDNDNFIKKHMSRATTVLVKESHFIRHSDFTTTTNLHPDNSFKGYRPFDILGVFEGLVVESRCHHYYTVRNPATRKLLHLPRPPGNDYSRQMWFNFNSSTREARLLCKYSVLSEDRYTLSEQGYKIIKIGEKEWRSLNPNRKKESLMLSRDEGKMYFIGLVKTGHDLDLQISSFDMRTENSVTIGNLPGGVFSDLSKLHPFLWDNCPAFGDVTVQDLQVLVLKKQEEGNDQYKWNENKIVVSLEILGERHPMIRDYFSPVEAISDDLWYRSLGRYEYCYDMRTKIIKDKRPWEKEKTFEYLPSLKMLEGMEPAGPGYV